MSVISLFHGNFCNEDRIVELLVAKSQYRLLTDEDIATRAAHLSGMSPDKLTRAFSAKTSVFNRFTHEKERAVAYLRLALAEQLSQDRLLIKGFCTHLIAQDISHNLRVCLIADTRSRIEFASGQDIPEKQAIKLIRQYDEDCTAWVKLNRGATDPWDASFYDMVIPPDKSEPDIIVALIMDNLSKQVLAKTEKSMRAVENFHLAAKIGAMLAKEGHNIEVKADNGRVTLVINKQVLMLNRLEAELEALVEKVEGVKSVRCEVGANFHQADIYRKYDFEMPSKILLVDDEREFVQTLSERLIMREMGSAVAYDGASALEMIAEHEPEVMILDLKMPGIDGIEVLRRVKKMNPDIEVIILTGHGSDVDREECMRLGAFAYLQKPVDIEKLSETIKQANEKINLKRKQKTEG